MMLFGDLVTALLLGGTVVQAASQQEYQDQGKQLLVFPAAYLVPMQAALNDFRKSHADWPCFRIIAVSQGDHLEINFSAPLVTTENANTGIITLGPQHKCGAAGAAYLVTMEGKITQRRRR